jgi:hypothetical protein
LSEYIDDQEPEEDVKKAHKKEKKEEDANSSFENECKIY